MAQSFTAKVTPKSERDSRSNPVVAIRAGESAHAGEELTAFLNWNRRFALVANCA